MWCEQTLYKNTGEVSTGTSPDTYTRLKVTVAKDRILIIWWVFPGTLCTFFFAGISCTLPSTFFFNYVGSSCVKKSGVFWLDGSLYFSLKRLFVLAFTASALSGLSIPAASVAGSSWGIGLSALGLLQRFTISCCADFGFPSPQTSISSQLDRTLLQGWMSLPCTSGYWYSVVASLSDPYTPLFYRPPSASLSLLQH